MQVGVEDLVLAQHLPLNLLRFLDLHDHVRVGEDGRGVGDDGRAGLFIVGVGEARARAGAGLNRDVVAMSDVFTHRRGRQADAVFVLLDLAGDADVHGSLPLSWAGRLCGRIALAQI